MADWIIATALTREFVTITVSSGSETATMTFKKREPLEEMKRQLAVNILKQREVVAKEQPWVSLDFKDFDTYLEDPSKGKGDANETQIGIQG